MRLSLLLAAAVAVLTACDSGPALSAETTLSPEEAIRLEEDAAVLAFRYQLAVEKDSGTVALPPALIQSLYQSLARVRESERGGLVEDIRARPTYLLHDLIVAADSSVTWTDAWRRGDLVTGYAPIDDLVRQYGLVLADYYEYPTVKTGLLRSGVPVNTVALARQFETISDLRYVTPNGVVGDGDDIEAVRLAGGWRFDFSRGTGDCPAGCINRTYWTFRATDGSVEYLGTRSR